jgi:acyl-CoA thioester hydrolase
MPYVHPVTVGPDDIDYLGHANNLCYLRWVQDAAVAHSAAVGLGIEQYRAQGGIFVVRRQEIDYLRPALVGDELEVSTHLHQVNGVTSYRHTEIRRRDDGGVTVLARAVTLWAYFDLTRGRPVRIPAAVRARFPVEPEASFVEA